MESSTAEATKELLEELSTTSYPFHYGDGQLKAGDNFPEITVPFCDECKSQGTGKGQKGPKDVAACIEKPVRE